MIPPLQGEGQGGGGWGGILISSEFLTRFMSQRYVLVFGLTYQKIFILNIIDMARTMNKCPNPAWLLTFYECSKFYVTPIVFTAIIAAAMRFSTPSFRYIFSR